MLLAHIKFLFRVDNGGVPSMHSARCAKHILFFKCLGGGGGDEDRYSGAFVWWVV